MVDDVNLVEEDERVEDGEGRVILFSNTAILAIDYIAKTPEG